MTDQEFLFSISNIVNDKVSHMEETFSVIINDRISRSEQVLSDAMDDKISRSERSLSDLMDEKFRSNLAPIENRLTKIELTIENNIVPRLNTIESCYTSTYDRYKNLADKMETSLEDMGIMKKAIGDHSHTTGKSYGPACIPA